MKPYIESILEQYTSAELEQVLQAIDTDTLAFSKTLAQFTTNDKGVAKIGLKLHWYSKLLKGVLVYRNFDTHFYSIENELVICYKLFANGNKSEKCGETSLDNFKLLVAQSIDTKSHYESDWEKVMKLVMVYDETNTTVEIGTHAYIDGNLKVDDNIQVSGTLSVGTLGTYDISEIGSSCSRDKLTQILQAFASGKAILYNNEVLTIDYYKNYDIGETDDLILKLKNSINTIRFEKQEDGSLVIYIQ